MYPVLVQGLLHVTGSAYSDRDGERVKVPISQFDKTCVYQSNRTRY